jgi:hypothetical protein
MNGRSDAMEKARPPCDSVHEFIEALADPDVHLRTDRWQAGGLVATTCWGDSSKAAIIDAIKRALSAS